MFTIALSIYTYRYYKSGILFSNRRNKVIIYGAGKAGLSVKNELPYSSNIILFIDDDKKMHYRSIDGVSIISSAKALEYLFDNNLKNSVTLIIALP